MNALGPIADRLEDVGHPGPAAAVRTLEFLLRLEHACDLGHALDHAIIRLRDDGQPEMREALERAIGDLRARQHRTDDPEPPQLNRMVRGGGNRRLMFTVPVPMATSPDGSLPAGTVVVRDNDGHYWSYTPDAR